MNRDGFYEYRGARFWLTSEVNITFVSGGKPKRVHNLLVLPSIEAAEALNKRLARYGDLSADGRPSLHLSAREMVKLVREISEEILIIPAHIWTPHFSIFGANSGFDSVEECFLDQAKEIFCLETGLSSDPGMNRRLSRLDRYTMLSNSDAHSAGRIGREANVLDCAPTPEAVTEVFKTGDPKRFLYTVEFFPEEGKYHFDGHRRCKARLSPRQARENKNLCPVCHRRVTIGVMHRIEDLADRPEGAPKGNIPFKRLVPLDQILSDVYQVGVASKKVTQAYLNLVQRVAPEFEILCEMSEADLRKNLPARIAEGVTRVRNEQVEVLPGYDGEYGRVNIFQEQENLEEQKQLMLF